MRLRPPVPEQAARRRRVRGLAVVVLACLTLACGVLGEGDSNGLRSTSGKAPPNVLVYMVDTLRADHLGTYGYDRETSPAIDRFAEEGIVFTRAIAQSSWTRASVASAFSGLHPPTHGAYGHDSALPDSVPTIAAVLRDAGYQTAGFVRNPTVAPEFGFGRGFDEYELVEEGGDEARITDLYSHELNGLAADWLRRRDPDRPFFLYLHSNDPHDPYTPPEDPDRPYPGDPSLSRVRSPYRIDAFLRSHPERRESEFRDHFIGLYDAEIVYNDRAFGKLIDLLRRLDVYDSTLVVLLSDHGEEFYEHGDWSHARNLYQEVLEIPLVIRLPGGRPAGRRIDALVQHVDLLPTLVDLLDLAEIGSLHGSSLLPLLAGEAGKERVVYSFLDDHRGSRFEAVLAGHHKVIREVPGDGSGIVEKVFDLREDPGETRDLAGTRPTLTRHLVTVLDEIGYRGQEVGVPTSVEIDPRTERALRALGYVH